MSQGLFTDADLETYIGDAMQQHAYGRSLVTRYRDAHGFIRYDHEPFTLENLPAVEEPLVAYLTAINCLWTLATDAATDIDISTAEGTFVPRTQRYRQLMQHIGDATSGLQGRYNTLAQQLNVGLGRIEMFTLRRVSRTTNRLVPVFQEREYDDSSMPQRLLPPIDGQEYADESGVPSPPTRACGGDGGCAGGWTGNAAGGTSTPRPRSFTGDCVGGSAPPATRSRTSGGSTASRKCTPSTTRRPESERGTTAAGSFPHCT
ncbi:hypothetical protein N7U49_21590 [Streptomyces sp. AD2-2]|nr:hypothetical protein N7U49_21590 [Streptomyces sp. AD2-2]